MCSKRYKPSHHQNQVVYGVVPGSKTPQAVLSPPPQKKRYIFLRLITSESNKDTEQSIVNGAEICEYSGWIIDDICLISISLMDST